MLQLSLVRLKFHRLSSASVGYYRSSYLATNNIKSSNASQRRCYGSYRGRDSDAPRNKLFLTFPAICFCLGTWQIYRRRWKLDLIDSLTRRTNQAPIEINGGSVSQLLFGSIEDIEYHPVRLVGEFDHSAEALIGPRHLIDPKSIDGAGAGGGSSLFSSGSGVGYHVVTPFQLADSGERVLVNRGWIPARFADPSTRPQGRQLGRVELTGLVRLSEPAGLFSNDEGQVPVSSSRSDSGSDRRVIKCRLRRDVESLSKELNTLPFFVDAGSNPTDFDSSNNGAQPIGGQTRLSLRNEHLSYVVTWYLLGGFLTLLWAMRIR